MYMYIILYKCAPTCALMYVHVHAYVCIQVLGEEVADRGGAGPPENEGQRVPDQGERCPVWRVRHCSQVSIPYLHAVCRKTCT